jgi:hypothetical protein
MAGRLRIVLEYTGSEEQREQAENDLRNPVKWSALLRTVAAAMDPPVDPPVLEKLFIRNTADQTDPTPMTDADLVWEAAESKANSE